MRWCPAVLGGLCGACAATNDWQGPLPVRNQHPAQLTVLHLDPAAAATLPQGAVAARADLAYTSLFLSGSGGGSSFAMDGELLRADLKLRIGLTDRVEAQAALPVLYTTGGFLDGFLIRYHQFFGLPDQDRRNVPENQFQVLATYQGTPVFAMQEHEFGFGDVPLALTASLLAPGPGTPGVAVRAGIELPTGDPDRGFGNGQLDWGGGVLLTLPLDPVTLHGHLQHTFAGSPPAARAAGLAFGDVTSAGLAAEIMLLDDLAALVQVEWETSTLRDLGFERVSKDQALIWLGARMRLHRGLHLELAIGEDLERFVSPDVTFWFGCAWRPGAGQ
jgi:hypothetical protein